VSKTSSLFAIAVLVSSTWPVPGAYVGKGRQAIAGADTRYTRSEGLRRDEFWLNQPSPAPRTWVTSPFGRGDSRGANRTQSRHALMSEVPHPSKHHGDPVLVGGLDHLIVADRAAGLDHGGGAGFDAGEHAVGEGEEGI